MTYRTLLRRCTTRLMAGAAAFAATFAVITGPASGQARAIDWNAVGRAIGQPLKTELARDLRAGLDQVHASRS